MTWKRMAVIGDSVAEGVREPVHGFEGLSWIDRISRELGAETLNLGMRNLLAADVRKTQLEPALAFSPDLAFVLCGANDTFRREFDYDGVVAELDLMIGSLTRAGALVVTCGLFDITKSGRIPAVSVDMFSTRLRLLSKVTEEVTARWGGLHVSFGEHPSAPDPSIYASDNLHLNAKGHAIAALETVTRLSEYYAASLEGRGQALPTS